MTKSRVCITVSNSPNPSRVYIRLCKHGKRFLLLKCIPVDAYARLSAECSIEGLEQQQSSQYPIFPSQARDQSFTRVARNETKYEKILDAADFARRENCSLIRLNDAFRKTLLKAAKKTLRQPTMRAEFSLIRALISN